MLTSLIRSRFRFLSKPAPCWMNRTARVRQMGVAVFAVWLLMNCSHVLAAGGGTWTPVATPNPAGGSGTMILLPDGSVMVFGGQGGDPQKIMKLSADTAGNYVNGTWSPLAPMGTKRLFDGTNVLPNGKVFVVGGEYSGPGLIQNFLNTGEIYDIKTNTWTPILDFPRSQFGDDPTVVLANGKILCGFLAGPETYLFDPKLNTWTQTGNRAPGARSDEETWLLLPDGSVLAYDVFRSPASGPGKAQRYIPSTGTWVDTGPVPDPLTSDALGRELGPATLLPDGRVFQVGANNNNVYYDPKTDKWTSGPKLPPNMGADDAPGAMLPNGNFIFAADFPLFNGPTSLWELDPVANTLTDVTPSGTLGSLLAANPAFLFRMLVLPNGHVLLSNEFSSTIFDYAPNGSPKPAWAPTITNITPKTGTTYTLSGKQLTGISEGASYGDDAEMSSNYPIVRFTSSTGVVTFANSHDWTPSVSFVGNTTPMTSQFDLPTGLADGTYQVAAIANGIASTNAEVTIKSNVITNVIIGTGNYGGNVVTSYNAATKKLTLTGDVSANAVSVTYDSGKKLITVAGLSGTKVNNKTTIQTYPHDGSTYKLNLGAVMSDGDDAVYVIGVDASLVYLNLGAGSDQAGLRLCTVDKLDVDGGLGTNTLVTTTSTIPPVGPNRILKNVTLIP